MSITTRVGKPSFLGCIPTAVIVSPSAALNVLQLLMLRLATI